MCRRKSPHFSTLRHGIPIIDHPAEGLETGIITQLPYEELEACVEANMDLSKWLDCEYTNEKKVTAVALYRMRRIVKQHTADAESKAIKNKSKD